MYLWLLSNRKLPRLRRKVIAFDARGHFATLRRTPGRKRRYLTDQHIAGLTEHYETVHAGGSEETQEVDGEDRALLLDTEDFGYQEVTVERPLRQHFEVGEATVTDAESWRTPAAFDGMPALVGGSSHAKRAELDHLGRVRGRLHHGAERTACNRGQLRSAVGWSRGATGSLVSTRGARSRAPSESGNRALTWEFSA